MEVEDDENDEKVKHGFDKNVRKAIRGNDYFFNPFSSIPWIRSYVQGNLLGTRSAPKPKREPHRFLW